jgi:hypothetical protein
VRIIQLTILAATHLSAIGVRQVEIRLQGGEAARATLWYPSASSGQPLRMSDYLHLEGHKGDLGEIVASVMAENASTIPAEMRAEALTTRFRALRDARPRAGRYPLVLWSPRSGSVAGQAYLSEALARAGFAVAVVEPLTGKSGGARDDVRKQVAYLEQSIGELSKLPQIDARRIAVIGWGYGVESAAQLAARNPSVLLLIALAPSGTPNEVKLNVPVVWFDERIPPEPSSADIHHVRLRDMKSSCFSTVEGWLASRVGVKDARACARGYEHATEIVVRHALYYVRSASPSPSERP